MKSDNYKDELLSLWEETYKKGQLTLWIFFALKDGSKYVSEIKSFITEFSENSINCEEQSLYRALRKFNHLQIVESSTGKGNKGPERKYYNLSILGKQLLNEFVNRNIKLFFNHKLMKLMEFNIEET